MKKSDYSRYTRYTLRNILLAVIALGFCGCSVFGPQSIMAGRGTYNEVINQTHDEQILNVLVRQRYDESFSMISVASVTANLQFRASIGWNIGFGPPADYAGNLVPLSGGVVYEDNPTISYIPLSGEDFLRRMLTPVSIIEMLLLRQYSYRPDLMPILAVHRINGLQNNLLTGKPTSPEFLRLVDLLGQLWKAGVVQTVKTTDTSGQEQIVWDIHDYQDGHRDKLREFLDLLGIKVKPGESKISLPLRNEAGSPDSAVHFTTRSAYSVLRVFGSGIEIPPSHLEAGIVEPLSSGLPEDKRVITIRSSKTPPDNATVQIRFRGRWFYIDASDTNSKRSFVFLRTFIGMRLADPAAGHQAPVITVPVR